jgi:DNA polymerase
VDARLYFIGQNPGEEEDVVGIPFIGEAGQEFNRWLAILGIDRAKVFVTNVVKCHTYSNRVPRASEISTCSNLWVPEELQALPDVQLVFPLGKPAVGRVLGKSAPPMTPLAVHHFQIRILDRAVSVFPLPHPAFFLRAQHLGPLFRETLLPQIRETLQQEFPAVYDACKRVSG